MDDLAKIACALGDPLRLRILDLLVAGRGTPCCSPTNPELPASVCACDIALALQCEPSKLAYHMGQLRAAGLVTEQRRGKWVYYSVAGDALVAFARALLARWPLESCCQLTAAAKRLGTRVTRAVGTRRS